MITRVETTTTDVDWSQVVALFEAVGWSQREPSEVARAFERSSVCCFVYVDGALAGFGRSVDDGRYYALLVDVIVAPHCQRRGLGKLVVANLVERLNGYRFITLTAAPAMDAFYEQIGWRRQKAAFMWPTSKAQELSYCE
jgi:ribosomal protein S18 acetylase RimI-like enzyme